MPRRGRAPCGPTTPARVLRAAGTLTSSARWRDDGTDSFGHRKDLVTEEAWATRACGARCTLRHEWTGQPRPMSSRGA